MNFSDSLRRFASKIDGVKMCCKTEEGTKHSLILPIIQMMGYNIFDPTEVVPEVDCDIRKSGEKVDYVIQHQEQHLILIECKHWTKNLDDYVGQLGGYFVSSDARFGILTNGVEYRCYTDLDKPNIMDEQPFLVVYMDDLTDEGLEGLEMFCKDTFNEDMILDKADELKCLKALREEVRQEFSEPSFELTTHFARRIYGQVPSKAVRERMRLLLSKVIKEFVGCKPDSDDIEETSSDEQKVLTAIRNVLGDMVSHERVELFVGSGYSSIRLDGCQWWPIIKFKYTDNTKWIALGKYLPQSYHFYCNTKDKHYITDEHDIISFSKDIQDIARVMLLDDDEHRASWVNKNRPDWTE